MFPIFRRPRAALFILLPFALVAAGCGAGEEAATTSSSSTSGSGGRGEGGGTGGAGGSGGAATPPKETLVSKSSQSSSEHEPQLVVTSKGRVVASWVDFNADPTNIYHVAYRVSDDLGATWGDVTSIPLPSDNNIASNTGLAANAAGDVWFVYGSEYVDMSGVRSHQRVFLAKLGAAAKTFDAPKELTDPSEQVGVYDQPAVSVTPKGDLLVTYGQADVSLASAWLVLQRSSDGGATWTKSAPLMSESMETYQNLAKPCVAPSGGDMYLYYSDGELGLTLWRSANDGSTWSPDARVAVQADSEMSTVSTMLDGNCVARGDEVWAVYGLTDQFGSHAEVSRLTHVRLAHSGDGGKTFDRRVTVDDAAVGPYYLLPRIALQPDGTLDLAYYAGTGEGDVKASYRHARSTDGGKTFAPSTTLRTPITYELSRSTEQWFGDYMGLVAHDGALLGTFIDNSAPQAHVVFFASAP